MKKLISLLFAFVALSNLYAQEEILPPQGLFVDNITQYSVTLNWQEDTSALCYIVCYKIPMSSDSITVVTPNNSLFIEQLSSATHYLWTVRSVNYSLDTSDYSNIASFYTLGWQNDCRTITGVRIAEQNSSFIRVQWSVDTLVDYYEIVCDQVGSNPDNTGIRVITNEQEVDFYGLELNRVYQFAVRTHCSASNYGNWNYIYTNYIDQNNLLSLPLQFTFDDTNTNHLGLISSNINPWFIDTIDSDYDNRGKSLFISSNNGVSNVYDPTHRAYSYAYIDFTTSDQAVSFYLDFDYKASINSSTDGLRLYLVGLGNYLDINHLPSYDYAIGANLYNNSGSSWQRVHIELPTAFIGVNRRLLFVWINSDTSQNNSSVIVDNIYLSERYCAIPDSLYVDNISYNSATIHWAMTYNQNSYNLQYKALEDTNWITREGITNNYTINNLSENTSYVYRVQANCVGESSFYSTLDTFTTNVIAMPPFNLSAQSTYDSAFLSWQGQDNDNYYLVYWKENIFALPFNIDTSYTNNLTLTNLSPNTQYVFKVKAVNINSDTSTFSSQSIFSTSCAPIDNYPYLMNNAIDYNSSVRFVNLPACYDTMTNVLYSPEFNFQSLDVPLLGFRLLNNNPVNIYVSTNGNNDYSLLQSIPSTNNNTAENHSILLSDYIGLTSVRFKFEFIESHDNTILGQLNNVTISNACAAPVYANFDTIGNDLVQISWNGLSNNTAWRVYLYDSDTNLINQMYVSTMVCGFYGLDSLSSYFLVIKALCGGQNSIDSLVLSFSTLGTQVNCAAPTNLQATWFNPNKSEQTIVVSWDSDPEIKVWQVNYKNIYAFSWQERIVTINPIFTIRNLDLGEKYIIRVRSICSDTDSSLFVYSDTIMVGQSGLDNIDSESLLQIYPNPTKGKININTFGKQIHNLKILDLNGKQILSLSPIDNQIDIYSLSEGIYYLVGYIEDKYFVKKIIKS